MNEVKLALEMNKLVHDQCNDVPHDIGLQLLEIVKRNVNEQLRQHLTSVSLPTDEQILKEANKYDIKDMNDAITRIRGFIVGATWMRDQAITANVKILAQLRFKTTKL